MQSCETHAKERDKEPYELAGDPMYLRLALRWRRVQRGPTGGLLAD